jgi:hypothetical protein
MPRRIGNKQFMRETANSSPALGQLLAATRKTCLFTLQNPQMKQQIQNSHNSSVTTILCIGYSFALRSPHRESAVSNFNVWQTDRSSLLCYSRPPNLAFSISSYQYCPFLLKLKLRDEDVGKGWSKQKRSRVSDWFKFYGTRCLWKIPVPNTSTVRIFIAGTVTMGDKCFCTDSRRRVIYFFMFKGPCIMNICQ